jgi:hypothetical protein
VPSQLKLQLSGLHITQNKFSSVPPGSLDIADNIVIQYPSVGQSRNGFEKYLDAPGVVQALTRYEGVLHGSINNTLYREASGSLVAYSGNITAPTGTRTRFLNSNQALYFTTEEGVKKIFTTGGSIRPAGVPRALDGEATVVVNKTFGSGDVNTTDNRVVITDHRYMTGVKVQVSNPGTLPGGIVAATDYFLRKVDDNNVSFYPTLADAQANTNIINITSAGSGTNTIEVQASPFLGAGKSVAYRVLYGYRDANEYLFRGAPSGRELAKNTGSVESSVTLKFQIPAGILAGDFVQIYRTVQFDASPNDELFLVTEIPITAAMITAGEFFYWDILPEALLSEALYTNATQQGILSANDEPPVCGDMDFYKGFHLYANTRRKEQTITQFVTVPELDQTITIGAEVYTAKNAQNIGSKHFLRGTGGTAQENIRSTAISLVRVINRGSSSYYAAYLSIGSPEGIILIYARTYAILPFYLTTTSSSLNPVPPAASVPPAPPTGILSDGERRPNRVCISKMQQPDAVPVSQFIEVGKQDTAVERVVALRDSIFVFKQEGIFRIVGDTFETMRVSVFDLSQQIIAPESAKVVDNSIFLMTNSSIIAVSDNGISPVGMPIEEPVLQSSKNANFRSLTFGIGDEVEKRYFLFYPTTSGLAQSDVGLCYSLLTGAWTRWTTPRNCGYAEDRLFFGGADVFGDHIYRERKSYSTEDFYDDSFDADLLGIDQITGIMTFDSSEIAEVVPGMEVQQGIAEAKILTKPSTTTVSVEFFDDSFKINRDFQDIDIDPVAHTIEIPLHGYETGDSYILKTTDTLPTPLALNTSYYVIVVDEDTIQLATSAANANTGTAIPVVDDGIGTHTVRSGALSITQPIAVKVAWNPTDAGNPGEVKHFQDCSYIFGNSTFTRAKAFFRTGFSRQNEETPLETIVSGLPWGLFPWGEAVWGDESEEEQIIRTYIPLEKRRATWIYIGVEIEQSRSNIQINGINVVLEQTTENFR